MFQTLDDLHEKRIVVVHHTTFTWGPNHMIALYLDRCKELLYIHHPFGNVIDQPTFYERFQYGKKISENKVGRGYKTDLITYIKDLFATVSIVISQRQKYDLFVGFDPLNALSGLVLKRIGLAKQVIFYAVDYSPQRFGSKLLNRIYHWVESYCARHSDYVWSVSRNVIDVFLSKGLVDEGNCHVAPSPIEKIYHNDDNKLEKPTLVYLGGLYPEKGIELLIDSVPGVLKDHPDVKVLIIGGGPFEKELRQMAQKLDLGNTIRFTGHVGSHQEAMEMLSKCTIAIAPYVPNNELYTAYAFPGKIAEYMACGLPIIMTRVQGIWKDIERKGAGIAIDYDVDSMVKAVDGILKDEDIYQRYRQESYKFAQEYYYINVFDKAFLSIGLAAKNP